MLKVRPSKLIIEPGGTQGTISEINTLIQMPQTHCFPKQRDLRPSGFYARAKDLGQNQSFKDFIEEVQRFIGQQPRVVWFVCISSGNSQASEELASHDYEGHPLPCGPFLSGHLYSGGGEPGGIRSLQRPGSAAQSSSLLGEGAYNLLSHQPSVN